MAVRAIGLLLARREHGTLRQEDNAAGKGFAFTGRLDENPPTHLGIGLWGYPLNASTHYRLCRFGGGPRTCLMSDS